MSPNQRTPVHPGYAQQVARNERRLGFVLWVALAAVLVALGI